MNVEKKLQERSRRLLDAIAIMTGMKYATSPIALSRFLGWPDLETRRRLKSLRSAGLLMADKPDGRHAITQTGRGHVRTARVDLELVEDLKRQRWPSKR